MKVCFVLKQDATGRQQPVLAETYALLQAQGIEVQVLYPEQALIRLDQLAVTADLYLIKSQTELALSLAAALHARGVRLLNPFPACMAVHDKIIATQIMRQAGLPTPRTWVVGDLAHLHVLADQLPLIIKPYHGYSGAGIQIAHIPADLANLIPADDPLLVQAFVAGSGVDLKVYVVGTHVFAVRKPFSATSFSQAGQPCTVDSTVAALARRCGELFGLGLYGIDLIESTHGPVVVDLNFFPGYKGIPGVAPLLAAYIEQAAHGHVQLLPPAWLAPSTYRSAGMC
jgi:ribosomal protein S6--L-glutamate ligase